MTLRINLLGRPRIEGSSGEAYRFRSRKSWALLAVLLLSERAPTRAELAALLFSEANDPLRALRWSLSEIRRALGDEGSIGGDPPRVELPAGSTVDVDIVMKGSWKDAIAVEGLGADLLDGFLIREAPAFSSWLLSEQRHLAATSEAILHEAALGFMAAGEPEEAIRFAVRATAMNPFDEGHQALLLRLYRRAGETDAAERQFTAYASLLEQELGVAPGDAVRAAMRVPEASAGNETDPAEVAAIIEAGAAAVAAGAVEPGVQSLRTAVGLADHTEVRELRTRSRQVLAEALIHSLRGFDEEGIAALHEIEEIAAPGDDQVRSHAHAELGYVDFLRARYDRSVKWLTSALGPGSRSTMVRARASTYLGAVESDRANYARAQALLEDGQGLAREAGLPRVEAYALSMLGRVNLLVGNLDAAAECLDRAVGAAEGDHWLAFLPWPQALRGEVALARDDHAAAEASLRHAFARACQLGDPCWEGLSSRGLAILAEATGEVDQAFDLLADARKRSNRFSDPYVWLDGHILDAQCELGIRHDHPNTAEWISEMKDLTSRTDMKELLARAMLHGARLGNPGDGEAAGLLAGEIDNPKLDALVQSHVRMVSASARSH